MAQRIIKGRFKTIRKIALHSDWRKKRCKKQGWKCAICGKRMLDPKKFPNHPARATLDHIIPISKNGDDHFENTQAVHYSCNQKKGNYLEETT